MASKGLHPGSDSPCVSTVSSPCPQKPSRDYKFMASAKFFCFFQVSGLWKAPLLVGISLLTSAVTFLRVEKPPRCPLKHAQDLCCAWNTLGSVNG